MPKEYIPGVQKGIESVLGAGVIAGFPVLGIKATLIDGSYHDVDSSVLAFEIAGRAATREGLRKCKSRLKEPIMKVDVQSPEEFLGEYMTDDYHYYHYYQHRHHHHHSLIALSNKIISLL